MDYVKRHKEITNILVSGGDAFMNSNAIIERYLRELTAIGHLDFIRFGSRVPVTLPERIWGDQEFLDLFRHYGQKKALYLVTQFNHPRELTDQAVRAVRAMIERGQLPIQPGIPRGQLSGEHPGDIGVVLALVELEDRLPAGQAADDLDLAPGVAHGVADGLAEAVLLGGVVSEEEPVLSRPVQPDVSAGGVHIQHLRPLGEGQGEAIRIQQYADELLTENQKVCPVLEEMELYIDNPPGESRLLLLLPEYAAGSLFVDTYSNGQGPPPGVRSVSAPWT